MVFCILLKKYTKTWSQIIVQAHLKLFRDEVGKHYVSELLCEAEILELKHLLNVWVFIVPSEDSWKEWNDRIQRFKTKF